MMEQAARLPASLEVIKYAGSRAAAVYALYEAGETIGPVREVVLTEAHLKLAKDMAIAAFRNTRIMDQFDARRDNAAKATASKAPDDTKRMYALGALVKAIDGSERRMISRKAALALPDVTPRLLDDIVTHHMGGIVELRGKHEIRMGKTERAYTFESEVSMDPEEAVAELDAAFAEAAVAEIDRSAPTVESDMRSRGKLTSLPDRNTQRVAQTADLLRRLKEKAEVNDDLHMLPAVPITQLTSPEIAMLPDLLDVHGSEVVLRREGTEPKHIYMLGREDYPEDEPAGLYEHELHEPGDEEPLVTRDTPTLWFRCRADGSDFRNWKMSNLGFHETWGRRLDDDGSRTEEAGHPEPRPGCTCGYMAQVTDPNCPVCQTEA